MLRRLLSSTVYVRIRANRLHVRHIESRRELELASKEPFSHERMLVGNFTGAADTLKLALKKLFDDSLFRPSPTVVIQPLENLAGGITEVEERVLKELALGAGARRVLLWVGNELSDAEVRGKVATGK